eukprot:1153750-Pelagomonas_calceolata.AAC.2
MCVHMCVRVCVRACVSPCPPLHARTCTVLSEHLLKPANASSGCDPAYGFEEARCLICLACPMRPSPKIVVFAADCTGV